jgi:hypothetical protein
VLYVSVGVPAGYIPDETTWGDPTLSRHFMLSYNPAFVVRLLVVRFDVLSVQILHAGHSCWRDTRNLKGTSAETMRFQEVHPSMTHTPTIRIQTISTLFGIQRLPDMAPSLCGDSE